ncbi:MAG: ammonium transporter [Streptomyces albidoflavus]
MVAILAVAAFSFVVTWVIAKVVDMVVGFSDKEAYRSVPGADEERAYDLRTTQQLDALAGPGGRGGLDERTLTEIRRLLRDNREG